MLEEDTYLITSGLHMNAYLLVLSDTHKYVHTTYMCAHTQMEVTFESH